MIFRLASTSIKVEYHADTGKIIVIADASGLHQALEKAMVSWFDDVGTPPVSHTPLPPKLVGSSNDECNYKPDTTSRCTPAGFRSCTRNVVDSALISNSRTSRRRGSCFTQDLEDLFDYAEWLDLSRNSTGNLNENRREEKSCHQAREFPWGIDSIMT